MTSIHDIIKNEIARQVPDAVKKELTPNFFEAFYNQIIFDTKLRQSVQTELPGVLSQNTGIVSQFVQMHLPGVLSQQHYFNSAVQQQATLFNNMLQNQQDKYQTAESRLISELDKATNRLVKQSVKNVSNQQFVVQQIKKGVMDDVKHKLDNDLKNINKRIDELNDNVTWGYVVSAGIGAGVGCFFTHILKSHL